MGDTLRSQTVSTKLQTIAEQARKNPDRIFTTLAYLMDVSFLREAQRRIRKDAAPGLDGVTAADYAQDLEENLQTLYDRIRSGKYRAPNVRRAWVEKDGGAKRPIGVQTVSVNCT